MIVSSTWDAQNFKTPASDAEFYGQEAHFNRDVIFYKNVTIHGELKFDYFKYDKLSLNDLDVYGTSRFFGPSYFYDTLTVTERFYVGRPETGGEVFRIDTADGRVGIASTQPKQPLDVNGIIVTTESIGIGSYIPEQRLDVAGSVKIDAEIFDSVNSPGKLSYILSRDAGGIRWIPQVGDIPPGEPDFTGDGPAGISTAFMFILDEGVPIFNP
jgi:hypothetical protein